MFCFVRSSARAVRRSNTSHQRLGEPRRTARRLVAGALAGLLLSAASYSQICAVYGSDGVGSGITGVVNTYWRGLSVSNIPGSTTITVSTGSVQGAGGTIAAGDLLLVMQMQDAQINSTNTTSYGNGVAGTPVRGSTALNNSGLYEYVVATGPMSGGGVIPVYGAGAGGILLRTYTDAAPTASRGQRRFQVILVPQYSSATVGAGLTAFPWNGDVGGVLAVDVETTLDLGGNTVNVSQQGFRGGGGRSISGNGTANDYRCLSTGNAHGSKAEGIAGTPRYIWNGAVVDNLIEGYPNGSYCQGAPGNAGGGGNDNVSNNAHNSGGGGGGNGGVGGRGGNTWSSNLARGGFGGASVAVDPARVMLGGGGGAGVSNNAGLPHGGRAGGIIMMRFGELTGGGTLTSNGEKPPTSTQDGAGGGGAGGSILAVACTGTLSGLSAVANGGAGGDSSWTAFDLHGPGGGGGGGVVMTSSAPTSTSVLGGVPGIATGPSNYFATAGASGGTSAAAPVWQASIGLYPGCLCRTTSALIADFSVEEQQFPTEVTWTTAGEAGSSAFRLLRREGDEWVQVGEWIPAGDLGEAGRYRVMDHDAPPGPKEYRVAELASGGRHLFHGPYVADGVTQHAARTDRRDAVRVAAGPARSANSSRRTLGRAGVDEDREEDSARSRGASRSALVSTTAGLTSDEILYAESAAPGLQHLSSDWLATQLGIDGADVDQLVAAHEIRLLLDNRVLGWFAEPAGDGLLYYLPDVADAFSTSTLVEVVPGRRGRSVGARAAAAGSGPDTSLQTLDSEIDEVLFLADGDDAEDFWYWKAVDAVAGTFELAPLTPTGAGTASLEIEHKHIQFSGHWPAELDVRVNGVAVGSAEWSEGGPMVEQLDFSAGLLVPGVNVVELVALAGPDGVPRFLVDRLSLTAQVSHQAEDGQFRLPGGAGDAAIRFPGAAASGDLRVLDIRNVLAPRWLTGTTVSVLGPDAEIAFSLNRRGDYVALDLNAAARAVPVPRIQTRYRPRLARLAPVEHVVLTPAEFEQAGEVLSAHRQTTGLTSRVVVAERVWQDFGGGQASPGALADFARMIAGRWGTRSLVLLGSGHLDYRNHFFGETNWLPAGVVASGGVAGSDQIYAASTGLVIGRIDVSTAEAAQDAVDALIDAEATAQPLRDWLVLADNTDDGGNFEAVASGIGAKLALGGSGSVQGLDSSTLAELRAFLPPWRTEGDALFFVGHGGTDRMAVEGIVVNADAADFAASPDVTSLGVALSCLIGRYEVPFLEPLAGTMVRAGAFQAFWAPSWTTVTAESAVLGQVVADILSEGQVQTMGDLVAQARGRARDLGIADTLLNRMVLFGDPGTPLVW